MIECPFEMIGDRICLVKKDDVDNEAGLILPESAKVDNFLVVAAMGPECTGDKFKVGDHVMVPLSNYEMVKVEHEGQMWFMTLEKCIPAIMK